MSSRPSVPGGRWKLSSRPARLAKSATWVFQPTAKRPPWLPWREFDFDSVLFPLSFPIWIQGHFGPAVHAQAKQHHRAVLALKAMAHQKWPESAEKRWDKTWYEPFDTLDKVALGLRFTLHLPVDAMIPPGHWELFEMAVGLAQSGALTPLNDEELQLVTTIAHDSNPVFTA